MNKNERVNEEATLNNNLGSSTLQTNRDIAKRHEKPKVAKPDRQDKK
ncbi:hypothetical protein [Oceanobacillus senegalensis]|nr:hypothetical protein [Oceanobacillus senegalensis]